MKSGNKAILLLIMIAACGLRFYDFFAIPYTHDEFSALFRTRFDTFTELINKGVIVDTLPAGVQVFLFYWIKLFGEAEWVVKLPFLLCGVCSVYLVYKVAKKWYNETVALITAAFVASLQYTVFYSQVARPYISGLFFSLLMVNALTNLIKTPEKRYYLNCLVFILAAAACAYNHHFSLVFAAMVGFTGMFMIRKEFLVKYLAACLLIILLYLPHINMILAQLQMGGNENWLGAFKWSFLYNYFRYIFQFSTVTYIMVGFLIVFGILGYKKSNFKPGPALLFLSWFVLPLLVGVVYSLFVNNVMQYSVLIFSFPYLLFLLFGLIQEQKPMVNLMLILLILLVNVSALVFERQHYSSLYESAYLHILKDGEEAVKSYKSVAALIDTDKEISDYYLQKEVYSANFYWVDSAFTRKRLVAFLDEQSHKTSYFYYGCLSTHDPVSVALIRDYYPKIIQQNNYFGGTTFLFSKGQATDENIIEWNGFETTERNFWSLVDTSRFVDSISFTGKYAYLVDSTDEWSLTYLRPLHEMAGDKDFIDISVEVMREDVPNSALLVACIEKGDSVCHWSSSVFADFEMNQSPRPGWIRTHHSVKLSDVAMEKRDLVIKIYIWNPGKNRFVIDDFIISRRAGNPLIYSWYQKI
ncbi:MAG TPA: glycosyltransferase family 39 protein [Bacteroidales bacterium]|nr:glycosyltransferase family 39 protein [Bacteroidales bacterium]HPS27778.1 glycosyltransferase family 39 protein [Bacteroidales bacterium]